MDQSKSRFWEGIVHLRIHLCVRRLDRCVDKYTLEEVKIRTLQDLDLSPQLGEACEGLRPSSQCSVFPCGLQGSVTCGEAQAGTHSGREQLLVTSSSRRNLSRFASAMHVKKWWLSGSTYCHNNLPKYERVECQVCTSECLSHDLFPVTVVKKGLHDT